MVERVKNKKGFTIIEIMVVIALIGILAAVLVPQFGGVRDRAKDTGVLTNAKMVEAYVASAIDSYKLSATAGTDFKDDIDAYFTDDNALTNPYTGSVEAATTINVSVEDEAGHSTGSEPGVIYVEIDTDTLDTYINGFDSKGNELEASKRTITR